MNNFSYICETLDIPSAGVRASSTSARHHCPAISRGHFGPTHRAVCRILIVLGHHSCKRPACLTCACSLGGRLRPAPLCPALPGSLCTRRVAVRFIRRTNRRPIVPGTARPGSAPRRGSARLSGPALRPGSPAPRRGSARLPRVVARLRTSAGPGGRSLPVRPVQLGGRSVGSPVPADGLCWSETCPVASPEPTGWGLPPGRPSG